MIWTLEGGYSSQAGSPARSLIVGQLGLPQGEDAGWSFRAGLFFDPDAIRGFSGLAYTRASEDTDLTLGLDVQLGSSTPVWTVSLQLRRYFG